MTAIVCELCGSNDIQKRDGMYVCHIAALNIPLKRHVNY